MITGADEIIEDLFPALEEEKFNKNNSESRNVINKRKAEGNFDSDELKVLSHLSSEPKGIEQLRELTHMGEAKMYPILTRLEITRNVKRLLGGRYVKA